MKIGKIISVEFDKFKVKLFHTTKTSTVSISGKVYYFGNIGSFLKVENTKGDTIICEVVAVLDNSAEGKIYSTYNLDSARELVIKPIGTLQKDRTFNMGVGIFPSIYSDVLIVTDIDIKDILETKIDEQKTDNFVHNEINIGYSKNLINYNVQLNINKLFNIHSAVLGNSGSGKSNTISHILQEVLRKEDNSGLGIKIVLFDINGEYQSAFSKKINEKKINVSLYKPNIPQQGHTKFYLPYYLMNLDEWTSFLLASDRTQKPFWDKVLQECYKFYRIKTGDKEDVEKFINYFRYKLHIIVNFILGRIDSDTAVITAAASALRKIGDILSSKDFKKITETKDFVKDIQELIDECTLSYGNNNDKLSEKLKAFDAKINKESAYELSEIKLRHGEYFDYKFLKIASDLVILEEEARGNSRIREFTSTMLGRLDYFLYNADCDFMKNYSGPTINSEADYLREIFGISKSTFDKQLTIIDSSEVSTDILELMTSVVSRLIFDYRKKQMGTDRRTQPVHLVLDEAHRYIKKNTDYILKDNIFEKIAREGRKFSMYLLVSSQRPSELSETVLSQCGNYIIHRIQNEMDMKYIYSVLPYFSSDYVNKIKQSVPGEALIFGNCVPMPLHIKVHKANPEPNSENCKINEEWYISPNAGSSAKKTKK